MKSFINWFSIIVLGSVPMLFFAWISKGDDLFLPVMGWIFGSGMVYMINISADNLKSALSTHLMVIVIVGSTVGIVSGLHFVVSLLT